MALIGSLTAFCCHHMCQAPSFMLTFNCYDYQLQESEDRQSRTIDFEFDPDTDTPDEIAIDLSKEFDLSSTDRCSATAPCSATLVHGSLVCGAQVAMACCCAWLQGYLRRCPQRVAGKGGSQQLIRAASAWVAHAPAARFVVSS
jgi:hypothetical protein